MKELREKVNLRTVDVASRLNISESSVRNWERGRATPRLQQIKDLTILYRCTFDELYEAMNLGRQGKSGDQ